MLPIKRIHEFSDVAKFQASPAYSILLDRVVSMSQLVKGLETPQEMNAAEYGPVVAEIVGILTKLSALIDEIKPVASHKRFGNPSYRTWRDAIEKVIAADGDNSDEVNNEAKFYLSNAFGSMQRIDYGTGHELNFVAYFDAKVRSAEVTGAATLYTFNVYFNVCKKLIKVYNLEPAGSHGVWGLDDHFHIPYILGAAQLAPFDASSNGPKPIDVCSEEKVRQYKDKYMYFEAIDFIYAMKSGRFSEHSPVLYDVSGIKTWTKILQGMIKMYQGEVLNKFPVIQHFYCGTLFPFE